MTDYAAYVDTHERPPTRTYECRDCRLPMSPENYFRTNGLCGTCRKERAYEPPPEISYEMGLCQSEFIEGPWPFFAPDGEIRNSTSKRQRVALAKEICSLCPCRDVCREWALKQGRDLYGIWGGTTRGERLLLQKRS